MTCAIGAVASAGDGLWRGVVRRLKNNSPPVVNWWRVREAISLLFPVAEGITGNFRGGFGQEIPSSPRWNSLLTGEKASKNSLRLDAVPPEPPVVYLIVKNNWQPRQGRIGGKSRV